MGELFRNNPKNTAAAVFDLTVQLDRQIYQRLYAIAPVSFAARRRLFIFSFATAWVACAPQMSEGAAITKSKAIALALEHLRLNRCSFFAPGDLDISEAEFLAQLARFDLAWKMIAGRLDSSQKAQSLAGLKRCIEEVLGDEEVETRKVSELVAELCEVLPKMAAAF